MWGAAVGLVVGGLAPTLARNLLGLRPQGTSPPPLPEPLNGDLVEKGAVAYGPEPRHQLVLVHPPVSGAVPGILLFHGGGFARGSRRDVLGLARSLARQGFAVAAADYRLLPRVDLSLIVDDAHRAARFVYENAEALGIDPQRLAIMGRSAGALLGMVAAYAGDVPFRAVVSEAGPTDLHPTMWDGSVRGALLQRFAGAEAEVLSPLSLATQAAPPTLLVHGCRDQIVPFAHSRLLQVRLEGLGVPVRLFALPRTRHVALTDRFSGAFAVVCDWLHRYVAPPPTPERCASSP